MTFIFFLCMLRFVCRPSHLNDMGLQDAKWNCYMSKLSYAYIYNLHSAAVLLTIHCNVLDFNFNVSYSQLKREKAQGIMILFALCKNEMKAFQD